MAASYSAVAHQAWISTESDPFSTVCASHNSVCSDRRQNARLDPNIPHKVYLSGKKGGIKCQSFSISMLVIFSDIARDITHISEELHGPYRGV